MKNVVIIADDFTGAGDSGVHFARGGFKTALLLDPLAIPQAFAGHDALALSTESRFMQPEEAYRAVHESALRCRQAGGLFFYKKTDSVLRGNVGAETAATLDALGYSAALVCSALPGAGRTCVNGELLLGGQPVHTTSLGQDPFTPVRTSNVAECIAGQAPLQAGLISLQDIAAGQEHLRRLVREHLDAGCRVLVADAASVEDLAALGKLVRYTYEADATVPPLLPVGSGGLAKAIAGGDHPTVVQPQGRLLAVVGSLSDAAGVQADFACANNAYSALFLDVQAGLRDPDAECARIAREAVQAGDAHMLLRGLHAPDQNTLSTAEGDAVAALFGRVAHTLCRALPFESIFATGGSTAVAVAGALGVTSVLLVDELLPGVVLSSCAGTEDTNIRWFISKAGSFGGQDTLAAIAAAAVRKM